MAAEFRSLLAVGGRGLAQVERGVFRGHGRKSQIQEQMSDVSRGVGHFGGQFDINCNVQEKLRCNWKLGTKAGVLSWDGFPGRGSWQTTGWLVSLLASSALACSLVRGSICVTDKLMRLAFLV